MEPPQRHTVLIVACVVLVGLSGCILLDMNSNDRDAAKMTIENEANESKAVEIAVSQSGENVAQYDFTLEPDEEVDRWLETRGDVRMVVSAEDVESNHTVEWNNDPANAISVSISANEIDSSVWQA